MSHQVGQQVALGPPGGDLLQFRGALGIDLTADLLLPHPHRPAADSPAGSSTVSGFLLFCTLR